LFSARKEVRREGEERMWDQMMSAGLETDYQYYSQMQRRVCVEAMMSSRQAVRKAEWTE
jgi:hypothetical protein